ncbi:MAG: hypothetical protein V4710_19320, partial [Verrucomicrobiota bacterium]
PRKIAGIQTAFRLGEPVWQATMRVERLPQSIQGDAFHLFSIGEGIAYGSSVLNYVISGAPVSAFKVELSDEYFNIEFTGKDIRNWQKSESGYVVYLHTPVSGAYTLLATYERPFKAHGETLAFTGARPLDAQSEQGHTIVISTYQFQVKPVDVSTGLLPLEPGEVPPEYRLFFDAPILAAYRYAARPFNLKLALSPLAQGDSLSQVVDRASLVTRISKEGQILTDAHYFVKNRGNPHLRLTLPAGTQLWSATVNGAAVVPVADTNANLVPLPQQADPNAVLAVDLKLAARSANPGKVEITTPIIAAPVMLAEWTLEPDTAQRLLYRSGSLTPVGGAPDISGFAGLMRLFAGPDNGLAILLLIAALVLLLLGTAVWAGVMRANVYKRTIRYWMGVVIGCMAFTFALLAFAKLGNLAMEHHGTLSREITFLAPVQQAGAALSVKVDNLPEKPAAFGWLEYAWPLFFVAALWTYAWLRKKPAWMIAGWIVLAWATLRFPNGMAAFIAVLALFFLCTLAIPALRRLWNVPGKPSSPMPPPIPPGLSTADLLLIAFLGLAGTSFAQAPAPTPLPATPLLPKGQPMAETVTQQIRVEEKFVLAAAKIQWQAQKGERLPVLFEPAVLTNIQYPATALKLVQISVGGKRIHQLLALESGTFDIELQYQVPVTKKEGESGFVLPTQFGLVNQVTLTLANLDMDVVSPQAVSIDQKPAGKESIATLVLSPANEIWIGWKPRSRDVTREKAVFYAEFTQLYAPTAGVIEGVHHAAIRPAQGELAELVFTIPKGATITDVFDPASIVPDQKAAASVVSQWRFDPDTGKLRVTLAPSQSRPFALVIRSQIATGPLPIEQTPGIVSVENAAGQIGLLGVATGSEVQLDSVNAGTLSPINFEDFPGHVAETLQIPGLTVRRAFRYADLKATVSFKASAVEPDVRVESQDTLSLGEDRALLAVNATVEITRAGIFRLSFVLPAGMDIESIAGEALSHWTEADRIITLHLKGRTEGKQQFAITLAGPGVKGAKGWVAPQLIFRETNKQRGTFLAVPEQGLRLQVAKRDGLTQLDPQKSGIKQKGVLAFRVLQTPWNLVLDIEQVDPWVQVTSLQHANVGESQLKIAANLQYQIENTGLKTFRVSLPVDAEN